MLFLITFVLVVYFFLVYLKRFIWFIFGIEKKKKSLKRNLFVERVIKYVPQTKTFHQGYRLNTKNKVFAVNYVIGEKGYYIKGKKAGFTTYRRDGRKGFGISFFERSVLFVYTNKKYKRGLFPYGRIKNYRSD